MINTGLFFLVLIFFSCSSQATNILTGQQSIESHGYFRTSLGFSEHGYSQAKFQAPGSRGKYRLGNEPDTNMELQFDYTYDMNNPENKNAHIQGIVMIDGYKNQGESQSFTVDNLAQGYLSFNQLFDDTMNIWLGRRYYQRKSVYIMNHYWLNPGQNSHSGIGLENINLNTGKLDVALFRSEDNFELSSITYLINNTLLDIRWHDLKLGNDTRLNFWAGYAFRPELTALNYKKQNGYGFGSWIDYQSTNTRNTTALIYQTDAAVTQSDFNPNAIREDLGWNLAQASAFEINNTLTYESLPDYSYQWILLFRQEDHGYANDSLYSWYSTGIRPIFYLSRHINIALEAGVDYVNDEINQRKGRLHKFTTALQISADRGFKSRPVLRLFFTIADWSDQFKGQVGHIPGDAPYVNDTEGWSLGAQTEVWW